MKLLIMGFGCLMSALSSAQDVTAFSNKENYNVRGSLQLGGTFYRALSGPQRYAPLGFFANGNLQFQLGAIEVPVSVSYNQLQGSVSNPFQLYGASPYYKWIKLHLGHRTLNFNPYVYNGRAFLGVGLELTPGKLNFTAFSGSLRNLLAIQDVDINGTLVLPSFERKIAGVKIGFGTKYSRFELSGVKVKDQAANDVIYTLNPQENFVLGSALNLRILKSIQFSANAATSLFTANSRATVPEDIVESISPYNSLHKINATTRLSFAGDASLSYTQKIFSLGLKYKRVQPYYYSLATNFLQNDIENYTVEGGLNLFKRMVRLKGTFGLQKDNLENTKSFTSNRLISSASLNFTPSKKASIHLRYSNYQHENSTGLVAINDTFRILTTTNTLMMNGLYQVYSTEQMQFSTNLNIFRNGIVDESMLSRGGFVGTGINLGFPIQWKLKNMSLTPSLFFNRYEFVDYTQGRVGAGASVSKSFFNKKYNVSLSGMYSQNQQDGKSNGQILNFSTNMSYKINASNSINLRLYYFDNVVIVGQANEELRGNMSYGYRF